MCLESSSGRPPCRSLAAPSIARGLHDSCALSALNNASKLPTIIDVGDECKNSVNTKTPSWTRKTVSCRGRLARPTRGDPRRDDGDDQGRLAREGEVIVRSLLRDRLRPLRGGGPNLASRGRDRGRIPFASPGVNVGTFYNDALRPPLPFTTTTTAGNSGRVDLGGCPPKSPTDPGLHITRTRFLIS